MLEIRNLSVRIEDKMVLKDVNLCIEQGETVALFGPNGSGKTTLLKTIMGVPSCQVESGRILFRERDITGFTIDERAKLGIGMAFQRPPAVRGVKLKNMVRICMERRGAFNEEESNAFAEELDLRNCLGRDINLGFSGGEIKRSELLQLLAQNPDFIMLDEPDSGVDLVSMNSVGKVINRLLEKDKMASKRTKSGLIITHAGYILEYINADKGYIMQHGSIICSGNPRDLLEDIKTEGFEGCIRCLR